MSQPCARWGCEKSATYTKPLCYKHWHEWEAWDLEECNRCHWFYSPGEAVLWGDDFTPEEEFPFMCDDCVDVTLIDSGKTPVWRNATPNKKPVCAHAEIERPLRYVYILKLADASFLCGPDQQPVYSATRA